MKAFTSFTGQRASHLEAISLLIFMAVVFLLPIFFFPTLSVPFQFTKTLVIVVGTFLALFALIVARLREGSVSFPINLVVAGGWLLALAYTASGLFASSSLSMSFVGQRFETDTVAFVALMALLVTVLPLVVRTKEHILRLFLALLLSALVLALYEVLRFVGGPDFLSFGVFNNATANPLGKWNDLGIFFGLTAMLSLMLLDGVELSRMLKVAAGVALAASLFVLAVVNFLPVWVAVGLFALGMFINGLLFKHSGTNEEKSAGVGEPSGGELGAFVAPKPMRRTRISFAALVVLILSLVFLLQGNTLGNYLSSVFNISQVEARPSWTTTIAIAGDTYKNSPIFGSAPNTFAEQWAQFKPAAINASAFWSVDFTSGVGTIPTSFITTGAVGAIAWAVFLLVLLYSGYRGLIARPPEDGTSYHLSLTAFVVAAYLWALAIVYVPSVVIYFFAFFFTGVFLASLRLSQAGLGEKTVVFSDNPRLGFVVVLLLTVVLIVTIVGLYSVGQRYLAAFHFQRSVINLNVEGDIDTASTNLERAVLLGATDAHYRLAAQIGLSRLNQIVNQTDGTIEERRTQFQQVLATTIRNAQLATETNPGNYQNWFTLGRVYQSVVPLQIEGSYESALGAYAEAQELSPTNPSIALAQAELEVLNNNPSRARSNLDRALELKNNYTAAMFLLAQLQIEAGEVNEALRSVEAATLLVPNNPVLFFQLGLLRFNNGDYTGAAQALERAVSLNEDYANARYFLGLSYDRLGRTGDAVAQFEVVEDLNPDNQEVQAILENLRAGREPFADLGTTADVRNRESLPIGGE